MEVQKKVLICYTHLQANLPETFYAPYLAALPKPLVSKINQYVQVHDRNSSTIGKHLLLNGLRQLGFDRKHLSSIQYGHNNRPFLSSLSQLDFNISHSKSLIVCALSLDVKLGIDVEEKSSINILNLKNQLSENQWEQLQGTPDPQAAFYQFWVQKEAIVKADGSGLLQDFSEIDIQGQRAFLNEQRWLLHELAIDSNYCAWLATDQMVEIKEYPVNFSPE